MNRSPFGHVVVRDGTRTLHTQRCRLDGLEAEAGRAAARWPDKEVWTQVGERRQRWNTTGLKPAPTDAPTDNAAAEANGALPEGLTHSEAPLFSWIWGGEGHYEVQAFSPAADAVRKTPQYKAAYAESMAWLKAENAAMPAENRIPGIESFHEEASDDFALRAAVNGWLPGEKLEASGYHTPVVREDQREYLIAQGAKPLDVHSLVQSASAVDAGTENAALRPAPRERVETAAVKGAQPASPTDLAGPPGAAAPHSGAVLCRASGSVSGVIPPPVAAAADRVEKISDGTAWPVALDASGTAYATCAHCTPGGEVLASDEEHDCTAYRTAGQTEPIPLAAEDAPVGSPCWIVGYPVSDTEESLGVTILPRRHTVTPAVVSGYDQICPYDTMQLDGYACGGNSGGVILNERGEAIGLYTSGYSESNEGGCIPISQVKSSLGMSSAERPAADTTTAGTETAALRSKPRDNSVFLGEGDAIPGSGGGGTEAGSAAADPQFDAATAAHLAACERYGYLDRLDGYGHSPEALKAMARGAAKADRELAKAGGASLTKLSVGAGSGAFVPLFGSECGPEIFGGAFMPLWNSETEHTSDPTQESAAGHVPLAVQKAAQSVETIETGEGTGSAWHGPGGMYTAAHVQPPGTVVGANGDHQAVVEGDASRDTARIPVPSNGQPIPLADHDPAEGQQLYMVGPGGYDGIVPCQVTGYTESASEIPTAVDGSPMQGSSVVVDTEPEQGMSGGAALGMDPQTGAVKSYGTIWAGGDGEGAIIPPSEIRTALGAPAQETTQDSGLAAAY